MKIRALKNMTTTEKDQFAEEALGAYEQGKISLIAYLGYKYSCAMKSEADAQGLALKLLEDMEVGIDPKEHPEIFPKWRDKEEARDWGDML